MSKKENREKIQLDVRRGRMSVTTQQPRIAVNRRGDLRAEAIRYYESVIQVCRKALAEIVPGEQEPIEPEEE